MLGSTRTSARRRAALLMTLCDPVARSPARLALAGRCSEPRSIAALPRLRCWELRSAARSRRARRRAHCPALCYAACPRPDAGDRPSAPRSTTAAANEEGEKRWVASHELQRKRSTGDTPGMPRARARIASLVPGEARKLLRPTPSSVGRRGTRALEKRAPPCAELRREGHGYQPRVRRRSARPSVAARAASARSAASRSLALAGRRPDATSPSTVEDLTRAPPRAPGPSAMRAAFFVAYLVLKVFATKLAATSSVSTIASRVRSSPLIASLLRVPGADVISVGQYGRRARKSPG